MKKKIPKILTGLVVVLLITGCASIFSGGPSWLAIETNPANVQIKISGIQNGEKITRITPCKVELKRNSDYKVVVRTPHYQSDEVIITRHIQGWFWGNFFIPIASPVGLVIDLVSDNFWDHNQHLLTLDLQRLSSIETAPDVVELNVPVQLISENSSEIKLVYLPITFRKITSI